MSTSENIRKLQPSATLAVAALARELREQGRDIIDLSAGEPDFPTPAFISSAGIEAIREGRTRYTAASGIPALREAIARYLNRRTGANVDPAGIVVTAGAKQALFNALFALFGPGDQVIVPVPFWTSYPDLVHLSRAEPVLLAGDAERSFKVSVAQLEDAARNGRVRGLILNSPSNPTGAVYNRAELEAIVRWAADHDVWLISDEIYSTIVYTDGGAPGMLDLAPHLPPRTVLIGGASKAFAMTGWRIGFSCSEPGLAKKMGALQSHITSNPNTPAQYAALAAFNAAGDDAATVDAMVDTFRRRRDLVVGWFRVALPGADFVFPEGAFYLFFRVDPFFTAEAPDSVALCRMLLDRTGVALVPGSAFGDDRYVRLSFAASEQALEEGIRRIGAALAR